MARGAHVWARPSSLGTGPVPRSHRERRGTVTGLLTAGRVRHIRVPVSWRPASAENGHGAKLPENPANMAYQDERARESMVWSVHEAHREEV